MGRERRPEISNAIGIKDIKMKVLVFIEQRSGKIKGSALETLTIGARLSGDAANCAAVVVGSNVEDLATQLKGYGCDHVFLADHESATNYNPLTYAAAISAAIKAFEPNVILGAASPMGRDVFPRLAARFDSGLVTDVTKVELAGDDIKCVKPMYSGKVLGNVTLPSSQYRFVTVRPNVEAAAKGEAGSATAEELSLEWPSVDSIKTLEVRKGRSEKPDLTEASIIIAGGRALGSADSFKMLSEAAEVIGATVGASRAAVDSGFAPHEMQVGQTGKTVNPNLYIACGISGSIQHMAGMRTSKIIVAINTDLDAAIYRVADYGIVADLFEAIPLLTEKLKELQG